MKNLGDMLKTTLSSPRASIEKNASFGGQSFADEHDTLNDEAEEFHRLSSDVQRNSSPAAYIKPPTAQEARRSLESNVPPSSGHSVWKSVFHPGSNSRNLGSGVYGSSKFDKPLPSDSTTVWEHIEKADKPIQHGAIKD